MEFRDIAVKMRDLWAGDADDSAAIDLMARFAVKDNLPVTADQFRDYVGDLSPRQYLELWQSFKIRSLTDPTPKGS